MEAIDVDDWADAQPPPNSDPSSPKDDDVPISTLLETFMDSQQSEDEPQPAQRSPMPPVDSDAETDAPVTGYAGQLCDIHENIEKLGIVVIYFGQKLQTHKFAALMSDDLDNLSLSIAAATNFITTTMHDHYAAITSSTVTAAEK